VNISEYIQSGIIETVVMGLAEPNEVAELEALRKQYPEVETYARQCEEWLEKTAMQQAVLVPAGGRDRFLETINTLSSDTDTVSQPATPVIPLATTNPKSTNGFKLMAAAAVILLIASAAVNIYLYQKYTKVNQAYADLNNLNTELAKQNKQQQTELTAYTKSTEIFSSPDYIKVPMAGKENYTATVFWNKKTASVYLIANQLPAAPKGKQYQLWALVDGKPVDAGVLQQCDNICAAKNISEAQAFAITLENEGGSPTPNLEQLYVLGKITG
jgi:Tfp pilus assembly major pilin PilA